MSSIDKSSNGTCFDSKNLHQWRYWKLSIYLPSSPIYGICLYIYTSWFYIAFIGSFVSHSGPRCQKFMIYLPLSPYKSILFWFAWLILKWIPQTPKKITDIENWANRKLSKNIMLQNLNKKYLYFIFAHLYFVARNLLDISFSAAIWSVDCLHKCVF